MRKGVKNSFANYIKYAFPEEPNGLFRFFGKINFPEIFFNKFLVEKLRVNAEISSLSILGYVFVRRLFISD